MAASAIATTTGTAERATPVARRIVLGLTLVAALAGGVASLRLAAVAAATPQAVLLVEFPPLVDDAVAIPDAVRERADYAARYLRDPALIRGRLGPCRVAEKDPADRAECYEAVDAALAAAPASGELWAYRAALLVADGDFGPDMRTALANSYATMPREGWLASRRVVLGMMLYPLLDDAAKAGAERDLDLVLRHPELAWPLVDAWVGSAPLRRAAADAIAKAPPELVAAFTARVQSRIDGMKKG